MKLLKYISFLFVGLLLFSSCEQTLEEINDDPTRISDAELRLLLPEVLTQSAFNQGNNTERVAGLIMQQFKGLDAQQIQYGDNYLLGEDVMNNYWQTGLYAGVLKSCKVVMDKAATEGATFYSGVAKVVMANNFGQATSMFGDIPFTEALLGVENLKPAYDTQEDVYNGVQAMLTDAITDLTDGAGYAGGDLVFGGDAAKWIATANALKARYHMHLTKRDANKASQDALTAIASALSSNADQPTFVFGTAQTDNWSLSKFGQERPSTLGFNPQFADMMMANGDPRMSKYTNANLDYYEGGNTDLVWAQDNSAIPMISYAEVKFIQAEAMARTGGDASAALTEAITASMQMVGLAEADYADYVAANGTVSGTQEEQIQHIIEQAYVAYYGHAFNSTWTNWRRTGYPALTASPVASLSFDPSGAIPQRYLYVENETQTNSVNVETARARQNGALLDVPCWAFE